MIDQNCRAEQFRELHVRGNSLILFNIWDAGSAKAVALGGAKAVATSSWSVANANGFADGEKISRAVAIDNLRRIVCATDLPVTVDLESGYGESLEAVGKTIGLAIEAGAVGCNLEDIFRGMESFVRQQISPLASGVRERSPTRPTSGFSSMPGQMYFFSGLPSSMMTS